MKKLLEKHDLFNSDFIGVNFICFFLGGFLLVYDKSLYILSIILIIPFLMILVLALIQGFLIKGEYEIFEQLLNDSVILKLVCDNQLKKQNWFVFEKALILRVQELVNNGIVYKFNYSDSEFVKDLVNYNAVKERAFKKQQCEIEAQQAQELQEKQTTEKAQIILKELSVDQNTHKARQ